MRSKKLCSILLVMALLISSFLSASQTTYAANNSKYLGVNETVLEYGEVVYVDGNNGNDTNSGEKTSPFKSIKRAFDYMADNCRDSGAVVIADGTYDVRDLFDTSRENLLYEYANMRISLLAQNMGGVSFVNVAEWMLVEHDKTARIKINFYGIIFQSSIKNYYIIGGDNWANEYYNCVFTKGFTGYSQIVKTANIKIDHCLFTGAPFQINYPYPVTGIGTNSATINTSMEPALGVKTNVLYNVSIDSSYNITSPGWQNAGTGKNPDGSRAHIGVYGGQFAWGSQVFEVTDPIDDGGILKIVMEVGEKLQLSINNQLVDNTNMTWISSNPLIASVDVNGVVSAVKKGEAVITVISADGTFTDVYHILVVDSANEYRLAVDLNIGEICYLTVDDLTDTIPVNWISSNPVIAVVSNTGRVVANTPGLTLIAALDSNHNEIGHVFVRVR